MGTSRRRTARELIDLVLDAGSYESWDEPVDISVRCDDYQEELRAAAEKARTDLSPLPPEGASVIR